MKGVNVWLGVAVVVGGGRTEKTLKIGHKIKVERKFTVVLVETQRGLIRILIDALLRSMSETVGLMLLQHTMQLECVQTRPADVTMVFVTIGDEMRQILHPHVVLVSTVRRI